MSILSAGSEKVFKAANRQVQRASETLEKTWQTIAQTAAEGLAIHVEAVGLDFLAPSNSSGRRKFWKAAKELVFAGMATGKGSKVTTLTTYFSQASQVVTYSKDLREAWKVSNFEVDLKSGYAALQKARKGAEPEMSREAEAVSGKKVGEVLALLETLRGLEAALKLLNPEVKFSRSSNMAVGADGRLHPVFPTTLAEQAAANQG